MLSLKRHIFAFCCLSALVLTTSAHAGLYGFNRTHNTPQPQHLDVPPRKISNYRRDMRHLAAAVSAFGKSKIPGFVVLPHEGQYLLNKSPWEYNLENYNRIRQADTYIDDESFLLGDVPDSEDETTKQIKNYAAVIDGIIVNNLYCQNKPLDSIIDSLNLPVFSIEQCPDEQSIDQAIADSFQNKTVIYPFTDINKAFKKSKHQLIINENADNVLKLSAARNISFILNDEDFASKADMLQDIRNSNYDIIIIRPTFHNKIPFDTEEVDAMKFKKNGARRLILSVFNLSEISPHDYLWQKNWQISAPEWIVGPSAINANAYVVKYWTPEWKRLVGHYVKSITDSGYDGIFLTGLENHRYFEQTLPLE